MSNNRYALFSVLCASFERNRVETKQKIYFSGTEFIELGR